MKVASSLSTQYCFRNNSPVNFPASFHPTFKLRNNHYSHKINSRQLDVKLALNDVSATTLSDPAQAQLTWQIIVGSLAGVAPFIVAGIEFNKRIVEQRRCEVCKGSGLVLRDKKYYFRCPSCGGFLPWQSWRRFFRG